jgi:hypothetical protein
MEGLTQAEAALIEEALQRLVRPCKTGVVTSWWTNHCLLRLLLRRPSQLQGSQGSSATSGPSTAPTHGVEPVTQLRRTVSSGGGSIDSNVPVGELFKQLLQAEQVRQGVPLPLR